MPLENDQEILSAFDILEHFAANSKISSVVMEGLNTVGHEVTRHFRSHEQQRTIREFFSRSSSSRFGFYDVLNISGH